MKSLSLSTPLVRTNMSRGGSPAVYMWSVKVSVLMVSGSGYRAVCDDEGLEGVSGRCNVDAVDETESSWPSPSCPNCPAVEGVSSIDGRVSGLANFLDLMLCEMRV